ncbi:hypothetical protein ASD48_40730 [Streptomyces sp. Root1310]|nr:hypothetical protein ASD48_40730 [Streptomyces sp. Root1310]
MAGYCRPALQGLSCRVLAAVCDVALIMDGYEHLDLYEIDFAPMEHDTGPFVLERRRAAG